MLIVIVIVVVMLTHGYFLKCTVALSREKKGSRSELNTWAPVPNRPYGLRGHSKATFEEADECRSFVELRTESLIQVTIAVV